MPTITAVVVHPAPSGAAPAVAACRYRLGLIQPPAAALPADGTPEWIELRPRWPLTSQKHAKSMPQTIRSMKNPDKFATSLTDMTQAELASLRQHQPQEEQQGGGVAAVAVIGASQAAAAAAVTAGMS